MINRKFLIVFLPLLSYVWLVSAVLIGGAHYPGYHHVSQFISELGTTGAPHGHLVNFMGLIPPEILILLFVGVAASLLPKSKWMISGLLSIAFYALAFGLAAVFSCDFECRPNQPTLAHNLHLLFGLSAYFFGILSVLFLVLAARTWPNARAIKSLGSVLGLAAVTLLLVFDPSSSFVGLIQRLLESVIYIWLIILAFYIRNEPSFYRQSSS